MSFRTRLEAGESRPRLADLYAPIAAELAHAERLFQAELQSRFPFVQHLVDHGADFQGKRLRPALVLLSGRACGRLTEAHPVLAAVVEGPPLSPLAEEFRQAFPWRHCRDQSLPFWKQDEARPIR